MKGPRYLKCLGKTKNSIVHGALKGMQRVNFVLDCTMI